MEKEFLLFLLRHGKTKGNASGRYIGRTDEGLSDAGRKELRKIPVPPADFIVLSPMKRCMETADIFYPGRERIYIPSFREIDFGEFEGRNYRELSGNVKYQRWVDSGGKLPFPGGEDREGFCKRVRHGFEEMMEKVSLYTAGNTKSRIAAIVHGGTIMAVLSAYHGGDYYDYQVKNGEGYVCEVARIKGRWKVKSLTSRSTSR